jgi:hypothetical protein
MRFSHIYETFFPDTEKGFGPVINLICSGNEPCAKSDVLSLSPDRMARIIEVDSSLVGGEVMLGIIV